MIEAMAGMITAYLVRPRILRMFSVIAPNQMQAGMKSALGRNRTCDQEIRRLLLYPLSYEGRAPVYRL